MNFFKCINISLFTTIFCVAAYSTSINAQENIDPELEIVQEESESEETVLDTFVISETENSVSNEEDVQEVVPSEDVEEEDKEETEIEEPEILLEPGKQKYEDYYVIAGTDGRIIKGITIFEGYAYITDATTGAIQIGFVREGDNTYYCDENGHMLTGQFKVDQVTITTNKKGWILVSENEEIPYFNQKDSRWSSTTVGGYTIGSTGCAINVLCSIYNYYYPDTYDPVSMGREMSEAGYYNAGFEGTLGSTFPYFCEKYGFDLIVCKTEEDAKSALLQGYLIAGGVKNCYYTEYYSYSHEILIYGYNADGTVNVYDPNSKYVNGQYNRNGTNTLSYIYSVRSGQASLYENTSFFAIGLRKELETLKDVDISLVEVHVGNQAYTGNEIIPSIEVSYQDRKGCVVRLVENEDYRIVNIYDNVQVGQASIGIEGLGHYIGTRTTVFDILNTAISNGNYIISAAENTSIVLHDPYSSTQIGEGYCVLTENGQIRQKFEITRLGNGYYTIKNLASGLYLSSQNMGNVPIRQERYENSSEIQWMIEVLDGKCIISSAWDRNYVFDIECTTLESDKNVFLRKREESDPYQYWVLKRL